MMLEEFYDSYPLDSHLYKRIADKLVKFSVMSINTYYQLQSSAEGHYPHQYSPRQRYINAGDALPRYLLCNWL